MTIIAYAIRRSKTLIKRIGNGTEHGYRNNSEYETKGPIACIFSRRKALVVAVPGVTVFGGLSLRFALVCMLGRIEDVHWEFQEQGSLQEYRHPCV